MIDMSLVDIRVGMARVEALLTEIAATDRSHSHEINQALPKLKEARCWVEGAIAKAGPAAALPPEQTPKNAWW